MNSGLSGLLQDRLRYLQFQGTNKQTTMIGDRRHFMNSGLSGLLHHRLRYPLFATKNGPCICSKMFKILFSPLPFGQQLQASGIRLQSLTLCVSKKRPQKESRRLKISGANNSSTLAKHIMVKKSHRWGSMRIHNTTKDRTEKIHPKKNKKSGKNHM